MSTARTTPHLRRRLTAVVAIVAGTAACGSGADEAGPVEAEPAAEAAEAGEDHAAHGHADGHEDVQPDAPTGAVMAPDFELATFGGGTARLSDYLGSPVAITFMHTY